jgi:hypothetical protein
MSKRTQSLARVAAPLFPRVKEFTAIEEVEDFRAERELFSPRKGNILVQGEITTCRELLAWVFELHFLAEHRALAGVLVDDRGHGLANAGHHVDCCVLLNDDAVFYGHQVSGLGRYLAAYYDWRRVLHGMLGRATREQQRCDNYDNTISATHSHPFLAVCEAAEAKLQLSSNRA